MATPAVALAEVIISMVEQGVKWILEMKAQNQLTDDQIEAAALKVAEGNDQVAQAILARIGKG